MSNQKQYTFSEMIDAIKWYRYPMEACFVTIWWTGLHEANQLASLLRDLGYRVHSYKNGYEIEIRFSYTTNVGKLTPQMY